MQELQQGRDKVKQICDLLKKEALKPAENEANQILEKARCQVDELLSQAKLKAKLILEEAHNEIEKQKKSFHVSLLQASRQTVQELKELIQNKLFHPELFRLVTQNLQKPEIIAQLITVMVEAIKKEGIDTDLNVAIAHSIPPKKICELLAQEVLQRLKDKQVTLSSIGGGIEVKLLQEKITIDFSDRAIQELLTQYIRPHFKDYIFNA